MESGTVKWFSAEKGYGFIERENGEELFVQFSDIKSEGYRILKHGEKVEFEIEDSNRGPKAADVIKQS